MVYVKKKDQYGHRRDPGGPLFGKGSDPFVSETKNLSDYRVHGIQINRLELTVSTQKSFFR